MNDIEIVSIESPIVDPSTFQPKIRITFDALFTLQNDKLTEEEKATMFYCQFVDACNEWTIKHKR